MKGNRVKFFVMQVPLTQFRMSSKCWDEGSEFDVREEMKRKNLRLQKNRYGKEWKNELSFSHQNFRPSRIEFQCIMWLIIEKGCEDEKEIPLGKLWDSFTDPDTFVSNRF